MKDMQPVVQMIATLIGIVGLLALIGLAFYVAWLIVMFLVRFLPMIGRRHKHPGWDGLQESSTHRDERG